MAKNPKQVARDEASINLPDKWSMVITARDKAEDRDRSERYKYLEGTALGQHFAKWENY